MQTPETKDEAAEPTRPGRPRLADKEKPSGAIERALKRAASLKTPAGYTHWSVFCVERGISRAAFWRWRKAGLPVTNFGIDPYVNDDGALRWFERGMRSEAPPATPAR